MTKMMFMEILSALPGTRTWVASTNKGNYVIVKDEGYTASYRRSPQNKRFDIIGFGQDVATFNQAQLACEKFDSELQ